jgi:MoxR-like ATPase
MRQARLEPVLLFLDEVNRVPRVHLNILLGLMNPKSGQACRQMGMDAVDEGPFYIVEAPMTSEIVACPAARLRIVAAGNFGRAYQVYDLDPAVRRRFDTVIEFDYLEYRDELALVRREAPDLGARAAEALVKLAQETRRLLTNGEMPGCVDTASLLNWAKKCMRNCDSSCARSSTNSLSSIMQAAKLTWADTVCGRDHTGRVNQGAFKALEDYLSSLAIL